MAGRAAGTELSQEGVRALLAQDAPGKPLPLLYLIGPDDDAAAWRATAFLLKCRAGGFMVAASFLEEVVNFFTAISEEADVSEGGALPVVWKEVAVSCETSRRRRVREVPLLLADLSWPHLVHFRRATASRASSGGTLLAITHEGNAVKPMPGPARDAADEWVTEQLSDATFLEYATAEELLEEPQDEDVDLGDNDPDLVAALRARVAQLEAAQTATRAAPPSLRGFRQTRPLLETGEGS